MGNCRKKLGFNSIQKSLKLISWAYLLSIFAQDGNSNFHLPCWLTGVLNRSFSAKFFRCLTVSHTENNKRVLRLKGLGLINGWKDSDDGWKYLTWMIVEKTWLGWWLKRIDLDYGWKDLTWMMIERTWLGWLLTGLDLDGSCKNMTWMMIERTWLGWWQ